VSSKIKGRNLKNSEKTLCYSSIKKQISEIKREYCMFLDTICFRNGKYWTNNKKSAYTDIAKIK